MLCWGSNIDAQIDIPHEEYITYSEVNDSQNQNQNQRNNASKNLIKINIHGSLPLNSKNNEFINVN